MKESKDKADIVTNLIAFFLMAVMFGLPVVGIGALVVSKYRDYREKEATAAEALEKQELVGKLAMSWNADQEWEDEIRNRERVRDTEMMTVDFQQLWLGKTILFVGELQDVVKLADGTYRVLVIHEGVFSSRLWTDSDFGIEVICSAQTGERLVQAYVNERGGDDPALAVVARISEISKVRRGRNGRRIGVGTCLDAAYLGVANIWPEQEQS